MVSIGGSVFYRPKDRAVHADNAHKAFHRGNVGESASWRDGGNGDWGSESASVWLRGEGGEAAPEEGLWASSKPPSIFPA